MLSLSLEKLVQIHLCWQSKKIKRIARSTLTAEASMADRTDSAMFLAALYSISSLKQSYQWKYDT